MKLRLTALATVATALAVPATASAAALTVDPALPCYGSGHSVNLLGSGFSPSLMSGISVTKDGEAIGTLSTDATGAFNGQLRLGQKDGRRTSIYTATDTSNPTLTASTQIVVSEADVGLAPKSGAPGRRVQDQGRGLHRRQRQPLRARHARRLDAQPAHRRAGGSVQEDHEAPPPAAARRARRGSTSSSSTRFRKYQERRAQSVGFTITVRRVVRPAAAASAAGWSRIC